MDSISAVDASSAESCESRDDKHIDEVATFSQRAPRAVLALIIRDKREPQLATRPTTEIGSIGRDEKRYQWYGVSQGE